MMRRISPACLLLALSISSGCAGGVITPSKHVTEGIRQRIRRGFGWRSRYIA